MQITVNRTELIYWSLSLTEFQYHRSAATVFMRCRLRRLTWRPRTFSAPTSTQAWVCREDCAKKTTSFTANMWKTDTCDMLVTCSISYKGISVSLKEDLPPTQHWKVFLKIKIKQRTISSLDCPHKKKVSDCTQFIRRSAVWFSGP